MSVYHLLLRKYFSSACYGGRVRFIFREAYCAVRERSATIPGLWIMIVTEVPRVDACGSGANQDCIGSNPVPVLQPSKECVVGLSNER